MQKLNYEADTGITSTSVHKPHEEVPPVQGISLDEQSKVRLLMQGLEPSKHLQYSNYILFYYSPRISVKKLCPN